jgi:hypothetical protein
MCGCIAQLLSHVYGNEESNEGQGRAVKSSVITEIPFSNPAVNPRQDFVFSLKNVCNVCASSGRKHERC